VNGTPPTVLPDIIMLTCRPKDSDFRYDLARELSALGHHVTYIYLKRRPDITDMATGTQASRSIPQLLRLFAGLRGRKPRPIVFQSTNLVLPMVIVALRRLSGARWVFDMHDDLLYAKTGMARRRARFAQSVMVAQSDVIVHAAATLQRLFPRSRHIGNGSSLQSLPKTTSDDRKVLILASLDERIDLSLMKAAIRACPARQFHVHGRIATRDPILKAELEELMEGEPNVTYHGPYTDRDLPTLLADYLVTFAPYKTGSILTEFIDPLRFQHCLASAVGIVSTPIPAAVDRSDELDAALDKAVAHRGGEHRTWRMVAERLQQIVGIG